MLNKVHLWVGGKIMPARQRFIYKGFRISVSPDFWLRRWTHFPFFFESHNPSFRVDFVKIEDVKEDFAVNFEIFFADKTMTSTDLYLIPSENIERGGKHRIVLRSIFTAIPGQTVIRMPLTAPRSTLDKQWYTLYAYKVRPEEHLWLWIVPPISAFVGAIIQRYIG
jgi:hypothetical protein